MQLSTIRDQIARLLRLSASVDNLSSDYDVWINETYRRVSSEANWPWLLTHDVLQTATEITTGTVSVASGSTALTFSSAPTPSVANDYRIQFSTTDDWYDISAHTAASTSATLADAYLGSSDISGGTYTLRKFWYSLPSDMDRLVSVTEATSNTPIRYIDPRRLKQLHPDVEQDANAPLLFTLEGLDSSKNWRIRFFPNPSSKINVDLWYYKTITDLSADTDVPIIPAKFHEILIWGTIAFYGYLFRDDAQRLQIARNNYDTILARMKSSILPTTDEMVAIQPWDVVRNPSRIGLAPLALPGDFGGIG